MVFRMFILACLLWYPRTYANDERKDNDKAKQYFDAQARKNGFNGVVLVKRKGYRLFKKAYGYANFDKRTKLNTNSIFQLASVSKTFTATAILMLIKKGKLKYTTKVTDIIPNFPYKNRTIKNLLNHKSGLPNYMYFAEQKNIWSNRNKMLTNEKLLNIMIKHKPIAYSSPGKRHLYCNTNYSLLATIIEKITKKSFSYFISHNILRPLKMTQTFVYDKRKLGKHPNKTVGFENKRRRYNEHYLDAVVGDKGIYSTVGDLLKFHNGLLTGKLLSHKIQKKAYTPSAWEGKYNYGYGWRTMNAGKHQLIYHNGWWRGYRNYFVRSNGDLIVILSNCVRGSSFRLKKLAKLL